MRSWGFLVAAVLIGCGGGSSSTPASDAGADAAETAVPAGPVVIEAGGVVEVPVTDGSARLRIGATGSEKYVVVVGSTRWDKGTTSFPWSVALDPIEGDTPSTAVDGCSLSSDGWKSAPPPTESAPSGTAPAVGTKRSLTIGGETIDAQVVATSKTAVVWADTTAAHPANLDPAFVSAFLADFDAVIVPRERQVWGVESDLDHDGHIGLVFSSLTYSTGVAFFDGCDLKGDMAGCPGGNAGEFLYLTPPDAIDPPYNTPTAMKEILAHEMGHLVEFNRKVLRNGLAKIPDSAYMEEGIGALAQDVIGWQAGNFYVTQAGLQQLDTFSLGDTLRDGAVYDMKRDGPMRGGSYLFARFLYDRGGGDVAGADGSVKGGGPALYRALLDSKESVTTALSTLTSAKIEDVAMDFFTALAMSDRDHATGGGVAPKNGCFAYLPQVNDPITMKPRGADLWGTFHGMNMGGPKMQKSQSGTLRMGGVVLVPVNASGGELDVTVTVDAGAVPRVRIGRIL